MLFAGVGPKRAAVDQACRREQDQIVEHGVGVLAPTQYYRGARLEGARNLHGERRVSSRTAFREHVDCLANIQALCCDFVVLTVHVEARIEYKRSV